MTFRPPQNVAGAALAIGALALTRRSAAEPESTGGPGTLKFLVK